MLWVTTIRAVNSIMRLLVTAYLIAEAEEYGVVSSIIAGYLLFSYRFFYQSVGLHAVSKYKLRQVLQISKFYVFLAITMCVLWISINFIEYQHKDLALLTLTMIILSLFCAYINELVRFSAKGLIRRSLFAIFETTRIFIEISIFVGLYYSYVNGTQVHIIPTIIFSTIIMAHLILSLCRDKSGFIKRLSKFFKIKIRFKKMSDSWNWYAFLLISSLLFNLDRIFMAAIHSNTLAYISAATICLPIVGAISFLNIWTLRTNYSLNRRIVMAYFILILSVVSIFIFIKLVDPAGKLGVHTYWVKFINENKIFLLFLCILLMARDFLAQITFEITTDISIYLILPALILFLYLASSGASWQYVALLPTFIYTALMLGHLAYVKSKIAVQHS